MAFLHKLKVGGLFLETKIMKRRRPLLIGFSLTNRCNQRCLYCHRWKNPGEELSTEEIYRIIDDFADMGAQRVTYTGGEPLLREDLGAIVSYTKSKGVFAGVNSNGLLIPEKIEELRDMDLLTLSLDGPEEVHDRQRGKGTFKAVLKALDVAKSEDIKTNIVCVLALYNLSTIDQILETAQSYGAKVFFQPASLVPGEIVPDKNIVPPSDAYQETVKRIIEYKKKGLPVNNSVGGLKHLLEYPKPRTISCSAWWIRCRIMPDGTLYICNRAPDRVTQTKKISCREKGFKEAFKRLPQPHCAACWCASSIELNLMYDMTWESLLNAVGFN